MAASPPPQRLRVAGAAFAWLLALMIVLSVLAIAWIGVRGVIAADHLRSARDTAVELVANIADPVAATTAIDKVADDARAAHALTSDPVWRVAELTPWLGPQLVAVSTVAEAVDATAAGALTPLAEVASTLSPDAFRPTGGRVELSGFIAMQDAAGESAQTVAAAAASLGRINDPALVAPLRDIVDEVSATFDDATGATAALANASVLLPAMLGADGPRNYLVIFQNNAEWRSLGGMAGSAAVIHTEGGAMQLVGQDYAAAFPRFPSAVLPLSPDVASIYGQRPARWMHNVTQVPDFALSGSLAREMWAQKHGLQVDGVIAVDPVTLSYLLAATGPVTLPTGDTLTADNAVQLLLNEVYLRYPDPSDQNLFFSAATSSVFAALASGATDPSALLGALGRAGDQRRLLMWSAHPDEQAVLESTTLAGALPVTDSVASRFGVFLNDGTGSKMDFYQSVDTAVSWDSCVLGADGQASGTAQLTVTLTNDAPAGLPEYITGGGFYGVAPGSANTVGYLYLPEGFELLDAQLSSGKGFGRGVHDQREVVSFDIVLAEGESVTATVTARSLAPTGADLIAQVTPTVDADAEDPVARCG